MKMEIKKINSFSPRTDGFVKIYTNVSDPVVEEYTLVEKITRVGSHEENGKTEDDFIVELVPKKIDEYNVDKIVAEQAKTCSLEAMIAQVKRTGDETLLNQREVVYGDSSHLPQDIIEAHNMVNQASGAASKIGVDDTIADMSPTELEALIASIVEKQKNLAGKVENKEQISAPEGENKEQISAPEGENK